MALGDRVILKTVSDAILGNGGHYGKILVGVLESGADPVQVQWGNGITAGVELALLKKLLDPADFANAKLGKWLQMVDWPFVETDDLTDSQPKSPGMSGVCVRALAVGAPGTTVVDGNFVQIVTDGGLFFAAEDIDPTSSPTEKPAFQARDGQRFA